MTTTVGPDNIEYVKALGAHTVINYRKQDFEVLMHGVDAVFDTVGGDTYVRSAEALLHVEKGSPRGNVVLRIAARD